MKCPTPGCPGKLKVDGTEEFDDLNLIYRYRRCPVCLVSVTTIEKIVVVKSSEKKT